ncbi:hypothetical protein [Streptomyces sp. S.PNR 29]|uniref:hypothetical protein n=1 Tax=Streptomyces sp. S.PNR 29 TaxID=2973805 RepID=UPI0025B15616|nr:hypothetical protein [Streptomyces sp. S.PNR 29]MDN0198759.1 hypothetical protein [Streptomyces sp. S.PNR 29]
MPSLTAVTLSQGEVYDADAVADVARRTFSFVFGTADSGVPNRARDDGLTFLDVLWEQAPFASSGRFVRAVRTLADTWLSAGLFTRTERDAVVAAAAGADLRR